MGLLPACGVFTTPAQVLARADRNLAAHDYRAAAVDLRNLIAKQPNDRALHLKLAEALLHTGAYVESDANFRRAQQLGAPWSSISADLAEALIGESQPQQALDLLAAHPPAGKSDARTLTLRGRALLALGKRDDAHAALAQALALDAADVPARVALATLLEEQGDSAGAKSALDAAVTAAPNDFSPHLALGIWFTRQRQLHDAHDELTRALDLAVTGIRAGREPWFDEYRVLAPLAENDLMLRDVPSAEQRVQRMRKLAPHEPPTLLLQARIDLAHRRTADARSVLQDLLSRDPRNEPAQVLLGAADAATGQLEQADMYLTAALAAAPGDRSARKLLTEVQLRESKPQQALRTATGADAALDADLLGLAGQASAQSGDLAGATTYLERSEKAAPQDSVRALQLATAYLAGHRDADALKLLQGLRVPEKLAPRREWLLLSALS
ncbi:MAG: tetratricopeptide repeat protein, partial [Steroidobacteraceae bacterium]